MQGLDEVFSIQEQHPGAPGRPGRKDAGATEVFEGHGRMRGSRGQDTPGRKAPGTRGRNNCKAACWTPRATAEAGTVARDCRRCEHAAPGSARQSFPPGLPGRWAGPRGLLGAVPHLPVMLKPFS